MSAIYLLCAAGWMNCGQTALTVIARVIAQAMTPACVVQISSGSGMICSRPFVSRFVIECPPVCVARTHRIISENGLKCYKQTQNRDTADATERALSCVV